MKKFLCVFAVLCAVMLMFCTAYAENLGYVKETDIVTFIDYCPIESFNYKGKTFVIAEALSKYGFNVLWNGDKRTLEITRPERNFTPYATDVINTKKENVTFKDIFKVYPTDIKTYINGNLAESYNIFGTTMVSVDAVGEYGGGYVQYDDGKRRLDVCIIEKEIENCEEKTENSENSVSGEKGFFGGDGNLLYGVKKYDNQSRYGKSYYYVYGDFANDKTVSVNGSYIYSNLEKYEYKNVENYQVNVFPSNLENPSFTMNFDEKATVYIEQDGRFKYGVRVRSAKFENGGEARYLPETGEIYLIHEKENSPYDEGVGAVYDDDGNEIYNSETYPRKFNGMLFKNGRKIYDGEIHLDRFEVVVGSASNEDVKRITALWAPGYTDTDGVIYYYSDSNDMYNEKADSILYRGNVVNGVMHGNGTMYYINYGMYSENMKEGREILVYGEGRVPGVMYSVDEYVMYEGEFKDGRIDGKGKMYRNGALTSDGKWKRGKKDGFMTEYNAYFDEIYLIYEGNYKDGEKNGEGVEYSPKGNPQFEGMYKSFAGTFENGMQKDGKHYGLKYNAEKNCHEVYEEE